MKSVGHHEYTFALFASRHEPYAPSLLMKQPQTHIMILVSNILELQAHLSAINLCQVARQDVVILSKLLCEKLVNYLFPRFVGVL